MKQLRGFTLIELLVVVTIVAILASIAVPAYRESIIKGNRRAAQSVMMDIVNRQQELFVANREFGETSDITLCASLPPEVSENYTCAIAATIGPPPGFTVTLTATGRQARDGNLSVDNLGRKTPADKW